MDLNYSIRSTGSYNKFVVVSDGVDISNELDLDTAGDLVRRLQNADRMNQGLPLYTKDDMPAILAALAGTDAQDAKDASDAHTWKTCTTGCTPGGRQCRESIRLWEVAHQLTNWTRAPFATRNRWGVRHGFLTMASALADVGMNGGEIIKAAEGAFEAEMEAADKRKAEADARLAERRAERLATGRSRRPASRR